jgi:hypothetical protein
MNTDSLFSPLHSQLPPKISFNTDLTREENYEKISNLHNDSLLSHYNNNNSDNKTEKRLFVEEFYEEKNENQKKNEKNNKNSKKIESYDQIFSPLKSEEKESNASSKNDEITTPFSFPKNISTNNNQNIQNFYSDNVFSPLGVSPINYKQSFSPIHSDSHHNDPLSLSKDVSIIQNTQNTPFFEKQNNSLKNNRKKKKKFFLFFFFKKIFFQRNKK